MRKLFALAIASAVVALLVLPGCVTHTAPPMATLIEGHVSDARTDAPIASVRIFALPAGEGTTSIPIGTPEVTSDSNGMFRIDEAPVGSVDLFIRPASGVAYSQSTVRLTTLATVEAEVTIRLVPVGVSVAAIDVQPRSLTIGSDQTRDFVAHVHTNDGLDYQPTWTVEGGVGTIDDTGHLKAGATGHGFVRATLGDQAGTSAISVTECVIADEPDYIPTGSQPQVFTVNEDGVCEVLVGYSQVSMRANAWSAVADVQGFVLRDLPIADASLAVVTPDKLDALRNDPRVEYVEPNIEVSIRQAQGDQVVPTNIRDVKANAVWGVDLSATAILPGRPTGAGVKVGVVDTGIDFTHPDLVVAGGTNIINPRTQPEDDNGHGTFASGIIGARDNAIGIIGVAPECELYAVKVLNDRGTGTIADVVSGIDWCAENGIRIINLSLGITDNVETVKRACDNAWSGGAGAILTAAAGNNEPVVYPGNYGSVISVGATNGTTQIAPFSSQGPPLELCAPGVDVFSCGLHATYVRNSGTSFSAPHVAGAAALLFSTGRYSDAAHVRQHLRNTAVDMGDPGRDETYGYGLIDVQHGYESLGCADVLVQ